MSCVDDDYACILQEKKQEINKSSKETPQMQENDQSNSDDPSQRPQEEGQDESPIEARQEETKAQQSLPRAWKIMKTHPIENIMEDSSTGMQTRSSHRQVVESDYLANISQIELRNVDEALNDES